MAQSSVMEMPCAHPEAGDHGSKIDDLLKTCVHCGFCLSACPTYLLTKEEMNSPRGRIYLINLNNSHQTQLTDATVRNFDLCLGCMACMTACPPSVQYNQLLEHTRSEIEENYKRPFWDRLYRKAIFTVFPNIAILRGMALGLWLYQVSGLGTLIRKLGIFKLLPERIGAVEALQPKISWRSLHNNVPARTPAKGNRRRQVGLLLGCVQRIFFADANAATARVLSAEGCDVIAPQEQGCCGAIMVHAGKTQEAKALARKLIDSFANTGVDTIVVNAAGCGSTLKEYGHLFSDEPDYIEKARAFSAKCKDISEILTEMEPQARRNPLPVRVAYHDACHHQHAQGIRTQPRDMLRAIPGLTLLEIPESTMCCGSAGTYNLTEPKPSQELGDRKVNNLLRTGAQLVVSGNPGCLLQIQSGLKRAGEDLPAMHMIELVDASIRGKCDITDI